jgi:hypothetical protein
MKKKGKKMGDLWYPSTGLLASLGDTARTAEKWIL